MIMAETLMTMIKLPLEKVTSEISAAVKHMLSERGMNKQKMLVDPFLGISL